MGIKKGTYVLACKYSDGDPQDHWAVGFFAGMVKEGRYDVVDSSGKPMRGNGFRAIRKISKRRGDLIVKLMTGDFYRYYWKSVWSLSNMTMKNLEDLVNTYTKEGV